MRPVRAGMIVVAAAMTAVVAGCTSQLSALPTRSRAAASAAPTPTRHALAAFPAGRHAAQNPGRTECGTAAVLISFVNNGAAAGTSFDDLNFTNVSGGSCYLVGWPGVSYVTRPHGRPVGAPATWAPGRPARVMVAPGQTAHAALTLAYIPLIGASAECPVDTQVRWLRVYPPGQEAPAFVSLGFTSAACTNGFGTLLTGPLRPGAATSELP